MRKVIFIDGPKYGKVEKVPYSYGDTFRVVEPIDVGLAFNSSLEPNIKQTIYHIHKLILFRQLFWIASQSPIIDQAEEAMTFGILMSDLAKEYVRDNQ